MLKKILSYGIIAGLIVGITLSAIVIGAGEHQPTSIGMAIGYATMLAGLSLVFVAIKRHRDVELGGVIRFWPALGLGLGISAVAGVLYVIAWDAACAIAGMDFAKDYADALIADERAKGVSGAALAKFAAEMEAFKASYANPLYRWPMTFSEIFPVGILVSLVSAGLLRNSRFLPARG